MKKTELKKEKGITLISLVVTIVVMMILASITIVSVTGENGLLSKMKGVRESSEMKVIKEELKSDILLNEVSNGTITDEVLIGILSNYGTVTYEEDGTTIKGVLISTGEEILILEVWNGIIVPAQGGEGGQLADAINPSITTALNASVLGGTVSLSISVTDGESGFGKVEFMHKLSEAENYTNTTIGTGGTLWSTEIQTITANLNLSIGTYKVKARVYDGAKNYIETPELTVEVTEISVWDSIKGIQTPALSEGMIPVKYDTSTSKWIVCSALSTDNEWYEYKDTTSSANSSNWANVMLMDGLTIKLTENVTIGQTTYDSGTTFTGENIKSYSREQMEQFSEKATVETEGSMFVWIPRYEYKITPKGSNSAGIIDVNFIESKEVKSPEYSIDSLGIATRVVNGNTYTIHPAFRDGSKAAEQISNGEIPFGNGEWDAEIPGIWVAKYEAGFQDENTPENPAIMSSKAYTTNTYTANALGQNLSDETKPTMTYPVFKKNKYSYNCINIGDMYTLCQEIKGASFYGLSSSSTTDSHLMKNSEWGAVAYLAHSKYGRNGTEATINSYNENNSSDNKFAKTGYESGNSSSSVMSTGSTSTTGNMTGIFDLSGGCWEYVAAFNSTGSILSNGSTFAGTGKDSTKYATKYVNGDSSQITSSNYKTGDATYETAGWNSDCSNCAYSSYPFFSRGGRYNGGLGTGIFASSNNDGSASYDSGFRPVLVAPQ